MTEIPPQPSMTVAAIYRRREEIQHNGYREHLGASAIGKPCARAIWYDFRWATHARHTGRLLRIFERGYLEEARLIRELQNIGVTVLELDPATGRQWTFRDISGHFGGSCDGIAIGILEAPKEWHLLEFKTANNKSFTALKNMGVIRAKPQHYMQMQVYMHLAGLQRALYLCVNKDNEDIYQERLHYSSEVAGHAFDKAAEIIRSLQPPARAFQDRTHYVCKFCDHSDVCWGGAKPYPHCRSCAFVAPSVNGKWWCDHHGRDMDRGEQEEGCDAHEYVEGF